MLDANDTVNDTHIDWGAGANQVSAVDIPFLNISPAVYTTLQDFVLSASSNGLISGGVITDGGSGTVDISAGEIYIRSSNSDVADLSSAEFAAVTGQALTDQATNIIHVEYNSGSPQIRVGSQSLTDPNSNVILGNVFRDGTDVHITNISVPSSQATQKLSLRLGQVQGLTRATGSIISETGTRNFALTTGTWWVAINQFSTTAIDTNGADTFDYYYSDGGSGFTKVAGETQIDNTQYDDGSGTLATLGNNKYGVHWIYKMLDQGTVGVYGLGTYSLADSQDATPPTSLPGFLTDLHSALVGKIVIKKSATTFTTIQTPFTTVFGQGIPIDHFDTSNLAWTLAGHTGTASTFAGFDGSGAASEYTEANYLLADGSRALTGSWDAGAFNITLDQLGLDDDDNSHHLLLSNINTQTTDLTLSLDTSDASRTLTITGNPTIADWFDQSVKSGTTPTFTATNITGVPAASVLAGTLGTGAYVFDNTVGGITTLTATTINIIDGNSIIAEDGSSNMTFTDAVTGTKTLAQLAAGGAESDPLAVHKDGSVALTANWDAGAFSITANQLLVGDADDTSTPSEYVGVGASQDGKFYSLAAGTVYLDATTSDADIKMRGNDGGVMTEFLSFDSSESILTLGVVGDIVVGDSTERDWYPQTDKKMNVGKSANKVNEIHCHSIDAGDGGVTNVLSTNNVSNPPTDAEIDTAFGNPSTVGAGFTGIIDDAGADTNVYICISTGTAWFTYTGVKAV